MVKTQLVIIQPTPLCNLNCHYCYLPHRTQKHHITLSTLKQIGKVFFSSPFVADEITIVWHASEPLVLPINFYRQAFHFLEGQNTQGVQIQHSFQTNATLITQEWCDFIKQQQIQIGVSIDGPQPIHDAHRVDRAGRGTFARVMRGIELLQKNEIPFSVIAVITQQSLVAAEEIWRFFHELRPERLCLNPEEGEGSNSISSLQGEEAVRKYKHFLRRLFVLNTQADEPLKIREFENIHKIVMADTPFIKSQTNVPGAIFSFDCKGNISTFSPELLTLQHRDYGDFHFGNVFSSSLSELLRTAKFLATEKQIRSGIHHCLESCEYFMFCGGGSPSNKLSEHNTFEATETQTCRLRIQSTADVVLEHWEEKFLMNASSPVS